MTAVLKCLGLDELPEHLSARKEEIYALSLIYDELVIKEDGVSGSLSIQVEVDGYILVNYGEEGSRLVRFLPDILFHFSTLTGYPDTQGPQIHLGCSWIPEEQLEGIEKELQKIWEDSRELCLYNMIDDLNERTKSVFDLRSLDVSQQIFEEIQVFSDKQENERFVAGIYFCEICLENKNGIDCFKLPVCDHIFCKQCLKDYYTLSITEGLINQVACINQKCIQSREINFTLPRTQEDHKIFEYISPNQLFPSTLVEIIADNPEIIKRYIRLIKQKFFEKMTSTIYCPRQICQAPIVPKDSNDLLIICTRCTFAFCGFCRWSWHGDGATCKLQDGILEKYMESDAEQRKLMETRYGEKILKKLLEGYTLDPQPETISEKQRRYMSSEKQRRYREDRQNEIAARKYIRENTMSCPKCTLVFEKSAGCNKMHCPRCSAIFCYLCGTLLDALSYAHFNSETSKTGCRGRLFEGVDEEGYQPVQEEGNGGPGERRQNYQVEGVEMGWREYEAQFWEEEEG